MIGKDIQLAARYLKADKLVAIPTETVYGLAGNALHEEAVSKIYTVKNRPVFNPLILHLGSREAAESYVRKIPELAQTLAKHFWPGPLTLILEKANHVPDIVTAGSSFVGLRVPNHPLTLELLKNLEFPLAAPSANPSGYISPTSPKHVQDQLGAQIAYILDGGPCQIGVESTIVKVVGEEFLILRKGGIPIEEIESLIGPVKLHTHNTENPDAPGMLKSHYAPSVPFVVGNLNQLVIEYQTKSIGIIAFRNPLAGIPEERQIVLSKTGNLEEAARNLYKGMRYLDTLNVEIILAELLPEFGLGRAINDRLMRAAA